MELQLEEKKIHAQNMALQCQLMMEQLMQPSATVAAAAPISQQQQQQQAQPARLPGGYPPQMPVAAPPPKASSLKIQNEVTNAIAKMTSNIAVAKRTSTVGKMETLQGSGKQPNRKQDRSRSRDKAVSASSSKPSEDKRTDCEDWEIPMLDKNDLVSQVKQWRKSSDTGRLQWISWVDEKGTNGKRDPAFYDSAFLEEFLNSAMKRSTATVALEKQEVAPAPKMDPVKDSLVQVIKQRQRSNDLKFKDRWHEYCMKYAAGMRGFKDPEKHDTAFLQAFMQLEDQRNRLIAANNSRQPGS
eukprot:gnl/MRDRNA2_/MRDRNA2_150697_c0_seq1.p1 gnl/MRDRNA2_/MRDRNA2_150697_c0~~gnl/MRDRNA2_/MRDRNA2_150697_c0_seq1.p1  ORF type:complete len:299 (+),score=72.60 gnl/MRDRNA2_/MRDRNA2_150697_c0_seq1:155-1051(+)